MFGITVETDAKAFEDDVRKLEAAFGNSAAKAVNATTDKVLEGLVEVIDRTVDDPTPFTLDAFAATKARPSGTPSAMVYVKDEQSEYLQYLFEGGVRTEPGGILVPGQGAQLDRYGNFPDGYLEMVEAGGGWWMTTKGGLDGLFVRNAYGNVEAVALRVPSVQYQKQADFPAEVAKITQRELPKALEKAFKDTFG